MKKVLVILLLLASVTIKAQNPNWINILIGQYVQQPNATFKNSDMVTVLRALQQNPDTTGLCTKIDSVKRKVASDSVFVYACGKKIFAFRDSTGSGGGGSQNLSQVLTVGNDAGGNDIVNVNNFTCTSVICDEVIAQLTLSADVLSDLLSQPAIGVGNKVLLNSIDGTSILDWNGFSSVQGQSKIIFPKHTTGAHIAAFKADNSLGDTVISAGGGTVTSVAALTLGTTGTDLTSSVANGTTTPVITLNVPTASASNRGALSSTDWTTFNNKGVGSVTNVSSADGNATVATQTTTPVITIVSAPKLQTARTINGTSFDGTGNITVTAVPSGSAGGSLTGTYPNPTIISSVSLSGSPTTTTQSPNDNSTKIATTAYVDGIGTVAWKIGGNSNLVDSASWLGTALNKPIIIKSKNKRYLILNDSTGFNGGFLTQMGNVDLINGIDSGAVLGWNETAEDFDKLERYPSRHGSGAGAALGWCHDEIIFPSGSSGLYGAAGGFEYFCGTGYDIYNLAVGDTTSTGSFPAHNINFTFSDQKKKVRISAGDSLTIKATQTNFSGSLNGLVGSLGINGGIQGISSAPTIAAGTGAGTSPSVSVIGTNLSGIVIVTTGTLPVGTSSAIATITLAGGVAYPTSAIAAISPATSAAGVASLAAALSGVTQVSITSTPTGFSIISGPTGLAPASTYIWAYVSVGF